VLAVLAVIVTIICVAGIIAGHYMPDMVAGPKEKLVEMGITSMSVNPDAVERTKKNVASAEMKVLLRRLAKLSGDQPRETNAETGD